MKQSTEALLDKVEETHDWSPQGTWSHGGTKLTHTDKCRVCCLERTSFSDEQNMIEERWQFIDVHGKELTLPQAAICDQGLQTERDEKRRNSFNALNVKGTGGFADNDEE